MRYNFAAHRRVVNVLTLDKYFETVFRVSKSYTAFHCTYSLSMAIFWTWIFQNIVKGYDQGVVGFLNVTLLQIYCWV